MQKFQNLGGWLLATVSFHQGTDFYPKNHRTKSGGLD
jgi:hypothetical protein